MIRKINVHVQPQTRMIMIGDIHGGLDLFKELLDKIHFNDHDELFLLGDYTERGPKNLEMIRYLMAFSQKKNVHLIMGNNDTVFYPVLIKQEGIKAYTLSHPFSLYREMFKESHVSFEEMNDDEEATWLYTHYKAEFDFLHNLPHIIETDYSFFIHGGCDDIDHYETIESRYVMKNDGFLNKGIKYKKRLFCGHYPTKLYRSFKESSNPIYDHSLNIVCCDGGYACSYAGQINAVILYDERDNHINYDYVDDEPYLISHVDHTVSYQPIHTLVYDRDAFEIIDKGLYKTIAKREDNGDIVTIPTSLLYKKNNKNYCFDTTNEELSFKKGDKLYITHSVGDSFIMKCEGMSGWVKKSDLGINFPFVRKGSMQDAYECNAMRGSLFKEINIPDADIFYEDGLKGRLFILEGEEGMLGSCSIEEDTLKVTRLFLVKEYDTRIYRELLSQKALELYRSKCWEVR